MLQRFPKLAVENPVPGVYFPPGSMKVWQAQRQLHLSKLVETVWIGDSTTLGSTPQESAHYSYLNRVRSRALAAGYSDGGRGIAGINDNATVAYDGIRCWSSKGGFDTTLDQENPLFREGFYSGAATSGTGPLVYQGKGTKFRLHYMVQGTPGSFSYAVNGGGATTVTPAANQGDSILLTGLPGGGATNTVSIHNVGGARLDVAGEFLFPTGIVFHKQASFGSNAFEMIFTGAGANASDPSKQYLRMQLAFGVKPGIAESANGYGNGQPKGSNPPYRDVALVGIHIGINDLQGAGTSYYGNDVFRAKQVVGHMIRMAKASGASVVLIIPHFICAQASAADSYAQVWRSEYLALGLANGIAVVDFNTPLEPLYLHGPSTTDEYDGDSNKSHLQTAGYQAQGDLLWDGLLAR